MRKYFKKVGEDKKKPKDIVNLLGEIKGTTSMKSATSVKSPRNSVKSATSTKSATSIKSPRSSVKGGKKDKTHPSQNKKRPKDALDEIEKKKARTISSPQKDPLNCVGNKVAKYFDADLFYGTVTSYTKSQGGLWHVRYDDGDEEDLDRTEVSEAMKLFATEAR